MQRLATGQIFGRYELLIPIAQGGMAQVWAARLNGTRGFKKVVALKMILPGVLDSDRLEQMFLEEATLAAQVLHPNVVATLELGEHAETLYLAMEWVDGESLNFLMKQAARSGRAPLAVAVHLIAQACKGLHSAHSVKDEHGQEMGVVHRDVSPHNILVTYSGTAKLVDFGIAKATQRANSLTETGELKGKLSYMAPEQLRGHAVDRRADLFAMGSVLYELTTGKHPFRADHPAQTLENIRSDKPVAPPSTVIEDYPQELEAVVLKALSKDPEKRFASAHEMLRALEIAMPHSLEGSFDAEVARWVMRVGGVRGQERRKQIRVAEELLDQARRGEGASRPANPSSCSALVLDLGTGSTLSRSPPSPLSGEPSGQLNPDDALRLAALRPKPYKRVAVAFAIVAVPLGAIINLTFSEDKPSGPESAAQLQAARPPAPTSEPPTTSPEALSVGSVDDSQGMIVTYSDDDVDEEETSTKSRSKPKRGTVARGTVARVPSAAAKATAAPEDKSPPPKPEASEARAASSPGDRKAAPKVDAWDPSAFGGRH